jgi:hypothetical protein
VWREDKYMSVGTVKWFNADKVSSAAKNASSEVPLAAGRWEEIVPLHGHAATRRR